MISELISRYKMLLKRKRFNEAQEIEAHIIKLANSYDNWTLRDKIFEAVSNAAIGG